MTRNELIRQCSRVYHMGHRDSWPSIKEHGLLSTTALLDLYQIKGPDRFRLESKWRPKSVSISHPVHGKAWIRDQWVMPETELQGVLVDMSTREWYEYLNRKTFFWGRRNRLNTFLNATNYRNDTHSVITVNTGALIQKYGESILLCDINSGFVYSGEKRGRNTFKAVSAFPTNTYVWELSVDYSVPEICEIAASVELWKRDKMLKVIWKP